MNVAKNKGEKANDTPTPIELVQYITDLLKPLDYKRVLDPACGSGILTSLMKGVDVIGYDILREKDFFDAGKEDVDLVICNPPFNRGGGGKGRVLLPEAFMDKIIDVVESGTPIILITPMGFRLNCRKASKRRCKMIEGHYPEISSIISLPLDIFKDVLFHTEVLCFNCDWLKPHYTYGEKISFRKNDL